MTLTRFQELLQKIDPKLRVRRRVGKNVAGLFVGMSGKGGYICRMNEGELHLNGWRIYTRDPKNPLEMQRGRIKSRGRKTVINFLRNYRWITSPKQRSMLTWGIEYPEEEVKGLTGKANY